MHGALSTLPLVAVCALLLAEGTHIFKLERDFSKLKTDESAAEHVGSILKKLRTFKVPVHPRIQLLYRLLKRGMERHSQRTADSLYAPHRYNNDKRSDELPL